MASGTSALLRVSGFAESVLSCHWASRRDSNTCYKKAKNSQWIATSRTLLVGKTGLEQAKQAIMSYKQGHTKELTPELWKAKKIIDSTLHPGSSPT